MFYSILFLLHDIYIVRQLDFNQYGSVALQSSYTKNMM